MRICASECVLAIDTATASWEKRKKKRMKEEIRQETRVARGGTWRDGNACHTEKHGAAWGNRKMMTNCLLGLNMVGKVK